MGIETTTYICTRVLIRETLRLSAKTINQLHASSNMRNIPSPFHGVITNNSDRLQASQKTRETGIFIQYEYHSKTRNKLVVQNDNFQIDRPPTYSVDMRTHNPIDTLQFLQSCWHYPHNLHNRTSHTVL